jgi:lysozyme family protein
MADFKIAYAETMRIEGGYANDPQDTGGETWKGVSRKNWPKWAGWALVDKAKKQPGFPTTLKTNSALQVLVMQFYKDNFWNVNRLSEFTDQSIAIEMFDTGVNMHPKQAALFLQRSLNVLNKNQALYPDIAADGVIGSKTILLTNKFNDPELLYNALNTLQGNRYFSICEANKSQERFFYGWATRVYGSVG